MRLVFETKQTKHADEVREWIEKNLNVSCSVIVHPNNTIITLSRKLSSSELEKLVKWIEEEMDGKLLKEKE